MTPAAFTHGNSDRPRSPPMNPDRHRTPEARPIYQQRTGVVIGPPPTSRGDHHEADPRQQATLPALELSGYARIDFRLDAEGRSYFLEANPIPTSPGRGIRPIGGARRLPYPPSSIGSSNSGSTARGEPGDRTLNVSLTVDVSHAMPILCSFGAPASSRAPHIRLPAVATAQSERDRASASSSIASSAAAIGTSSSTSSLRLWTQDGWTGCPSPDHADRDGQRRWGIHPHPPRPTALRRSPRHLGHATAPNTTEDVRRRELARMMKLGLVPTSRASRGRSASGSPIPPRRTPRRPGAQHGRGSLEPLGLSDPGNGGGAAESRASNYELTSNVSASRVTEEWKVTFWGGLEYRFNRFQLADSTERRFVLRNADGGARLVRSLSDHWSVADARTPASPSSGTRISSALSRRRRVQSLPVAGGDEPAVPRDPLHRRALLRLYEETIYGQRTEFRPVARAIVAGRAGRPGGPSTPPCATPVSARHQDQ